MRRRMMQKKEDTSEVFNNALSVLHFDAKENTDAKGNAIIWNSSYAVSFVAGKFGNALSAGRCMVNLPVSTINIKTFTLSCHVKAFNISGDDATSVRINPNSGNSAVSVIGFNVGYQSPGSVKLLIGGGSGGTWADSSTRIGNIPLDSAWHHFEMTYKSGTITTFVDGIKFGTVTKTLPTMTDYRRIGVMVGNASCIDEVVYTSEILHTENFTPPSRPYRK